MAVENVPVTLMCTSNGGKPTPQLVITRDGSTLPTGSSPLSYTFSLTTADEGAVFICNATNFVDTVTTSQSFTIASKLCLPSNCMANAKLSHSTAPPDGAALSNSLGITNMETGSEVTFTCTSTGGAPTPAIDFYQGVTLAKS